jgi:pimeloyl-ACP methyl ester carboxylesterase
LSDSDFVSVDGRMIEYRRFASNHAVQGRPVIVALHEGLGSLEMWKDLPERLARAAGTDVVAYSRFGYGRSDPLPEPYDALRMHEQEARILPEVLRALHIEQPVLFGHSDGASIALIYAAQAPRGAAGVIALAPHVFVEDLCIASIEEVRRTYLATDMRLKLGRYHDDPDRAFWGWNDVWLDRSFRGWNIEHFLPAIRCPILAIQGYEDEYGTMEQLARLQRAVPQTQLLQLRQCRHSPHRDQASAVLKAVAQWMEDVLGKSSAIGSQLSK